MAKRRLAEVRADLTFKGRQFTAKVILWAIRWARQSRAASGPALCERAGRGYVLAPLRAAFAAVGCTVHTPPKRGMADPPAWDPALYARRHHVEHLFSRLKDFTRIALRRDKTRRSWTGFAHLAATVINLRITEFSH